MNYFYYFELRRRYRQWARHLRPAPKISYKTYQRVYIVIAFPLFYGIWHYFGSKLYEQMFYDWDESIGEVREYTPLEKYERVKQQTDEYNASKNKKTQKKTEKVRVSQMSFPLDD